MTHRGLLHAIGVMAASAAMLHAQSPTQGGKVQGTSKVERPITVVGCVRPGATAVGTTGSSSNAQANHFVLTDIAAPAPPAALPSGAASPSGTASPSGAPTSSGAASAAGRQPATAEAGSSSNVPLPTSLTGGQPVVLEGAAVAPHLNQRVELTGTIVPVDAKGETASGAGAAGDAKMQRLNVTTVVRVLGTCGPR